MNNNIEIKFLIPKQYKKYQTELMSIFNENFFRNGGMLYSDDFLVNSSDIIIAKCDRLIVAYMAISFNVENELDRENEIYLEEPKLKNSLVIKHLVVKEQYRNLSIATKLIKKLKQYAMNNEIHNLYLWTTPNNTIALNFYKKSGFYKMGEYNPPNGVFQGLNNFRSIMMASHI